MYHSGIMIEQTETKPYSRELSEFESIGRENNRNFNLLLRVVESDIPARGKHKMIAEIVPNKEFFNDTYSLAEPVAVNFSIYPKKSSPGEKNLGHSAKFEFTQNKEGRIFATQFLNFTEARGIDIKDFVVKAKITTDLGETLNINSKIDMSLFIPKAPPSAEKKLTKLKPLRTAADSEIKEYFGNIEGVVSGKKFLGN